MHVYFVYNPKTFYFRFTVLTQEKHAFSVIKMFFQSAFIFCLINFVKGISLQEVSVIFGDKNCVAGSLETFVQDDSDTTIQDTVQSKIENLDFSSSDKSAMSSINELAQYNDISYSYELIKEEGPAHSKTFVVTLYLGDEQYTSEMKKSIKKAQQDAAGIALKNTNYQHPPVKIKESEKSLTPTVLLNNLAAKLGLAVTYTVITDDLLEDLNNQNNETDFIPKKSYLQQLNETAHSNDSIHIRKDGGDLKGPFVVKVDVNGVKFIGKAHTIQNAKHDAAAKALKNLKDNEDALYCLKEDDNCKSKKQTIKSPISLVYEAAQRRNLGVTFEVIDEVGPSHKKLFTTKCEIGDLEATGQGKSKKESKRVAAENILPRLLEIPEVKGSTTKISNPTKTKSKKKKDKVIKTTFDKIDRVLDNVVDFGKGLVDSITGSKDSSNDNSKPSKNKDGKTKRSPADEVLELGKILNLEIRYSDFVENNKIYSVLDLGTKPSFMCLGEGVTQKNSRDLAAKYGINALYKLGLLDNLLDKSMEISNVLDKEQAFQKFWLQVIEDEEKTK